MLVLAPHPDDETFCAGALVLHRRAGHPVTVAMLTDGRASRQLGLSPDEMALRRREEAGQACAVLGISRLEWLGLYDLDWKDEQARPRLTELLDALRPTTLYAPSCVDGHPDHRRLARLLAEVLAGYPQPLRVRCLQLQVPLTPALTNLVIDTSSARRETVAAIHAYPSQRHSLERSLRPRLYAARLYGAGALAEEFWELSRDEYVRVHLRPMKEWHRRFVGLRPGALRDPYAYLAGAGERLRLRRLSADQALRILGGE